MKNEDNDKIIASVFGSMAIEGLHCTDEDKHRTIDILSGNKSTDDHSQIYLSILKSLPVAILWVTL